MLNTTSEDFFDAMYLESPDPWNFACDAYEQSRYASIIASLGTTRFRLAVEPGCSVGALTERLADVCDRVEASDISATAVKQAQARCAAKQNVRIKHGKFDGSIPDGCDLLLLCEIGYYFAQEQLLEVIRRALSKLEPGTTVLACHWLGTSEDHILTGDQVHNILHELTDLKHEHAERHENFRLDRWRKEGAQ